MSDGTTTIAQVADVVDRAAFDASFRQQLIASPADKRLFTQSLDDMQG